MESAPQFREECRRPDAPGARCRAQARAAVNLRSLAEQSLQGGALQAACVKTPQPDTIMGLPICGLVVEPRHKDDRQLRMRPLQVASNLDSRQSIRVGYREGGESIALSPSVLQEFIGRGEQNLTSNSSAVSRIPAALSTLQIVIEHAERLS